MGCKGNILVVDDTLATLRLLVNMLVNQGYEVRPAPNGALALRAAQSTAPDLILLDISLPEMDGWEVTKAIRSDEHIKHIPIIAVTAHAMAGDEDKAYEQGCNAYMSKPIDEDVLWAKVAEHIA